MQLIFETKNKNTRLIQKDIIQFACYYKVADCLDTSLRLFREWMQSGHTRNQ